MQQRVRRAVTAGFCSIAPFQTYIFSGLTFDQNAVRASQSMAALNTVKKTPHVPKNYCQTAENLRFRSLFDTKLVFCTIGGVGAGLVGALLPIHQNPKLW